MGDDVRLTIREAAELLGCSKFWITNQVIRGHLEYTQPERPHLLLRRDVEELMAKVKAARAWRNELDRLRAERKKRAAEVRAVDRAIGQLMARRPAKYLGLRRNGKYKPRAKSKGA